MLHREGISRLCVGAFDPDAGFGPTRAGRPSLTRWTLFPRGSASLDPIFDFFNAGINSGLPRLELRFTDDLRKSGPRINYPVPTRRGAFLYVKFYLAMSQESSCSFRPNQHPTLALPSPTTYPPFRFCSAGESYRLRFGNAVYQVGFVLWSIPSVDGSPNLSAEIGERPFQYAPSPNVN